MSWLWRPGNLNWWIGAIFAIGSLLFAAASLLSLQPELAGWLMLESRVNAIFFAGSIPFTTAAWLQLYQSANAQQPSGERRKWFGWRPRDAGWLSCALQFVGTVLFNINTFDAMIPSMDWLQEDLVVWVPDIIGSVLFLASGYLAFVEAGPHRWWFRPSDLTWWVVATNLLGCVGFMISACFAIAFPTATEAWPTISIFFTMVGAIFFLLGSLLMIVEADFE